MSSFQTIGLDFRRVKMNTMNVSKHGLMAVFMVWYLKCVIYGVSIEFQSALSGLKVLNTLIPQIQKVLSTSIRRETVKTGPLYKTQYRPSEDNYKNIYIYISITLQYELHLLSVIVQVRLSLIWSETLKTGFLVTRFIWQLFLFHW